ncbi:helix-turn-helix transcriptional regulator [Actinorhabdospora filicis]|uniref:helix-turn-helix transcriptional regulator n=1 Tax=Actinorhabdospora filicis TaxID=1785913 RepID=UPI002556B79F|nr:WYL domain-containing protein [Actinorhabdospora filicis]
MSRSRTERLVNLVICLLSTRRHLTAAEIARTVPGYEHDARDSRAHEAFQRKFERDKAELRELGIPVEMGTDSILDTEVGYRIARREYELPELHLHADEAAALGVAARLWQHAGLASRATSALAKLRAGGVDVDDAEYEDFAPVSTVDEALAPMLAAVNVRRVVEFTYRVPSADVAARRRLQPWGVVCYRGRWYVVGHDLDRDAERCFRLSRILGPVATTGEAGAYEIPVTGDLIRHVADAPQAPSRRATVRVRPGRAAGVRRRAVQILPRAGAVDRIVVPYTDARSLARTLVRYGPDVTVEDPPEVRKEIVALLTEMAAVGGAR